jgi:hypothetical protein
MNGDTEHAGGFSMGARKKLLHHASDTGSSERCAMFLLSL